MTTINRVNNYLSLIKFSHTIFALPFAIIGFFLAITFNNVAFDIKLFLYVLLCMVFARSAAMAFNRYADRSFDKLNPRTAVREIPAGLSAGSDQSRWALLSPDAEQCHLPFGRWPVENPGV